MARASRGRCLEVKCSWMIISRWLRSHPCVAPPTPVTLKLKVELAELKPGAQTMLRKEDMGCSGPPARPNLRDIYLTKTGL